MPTDRTAPVPHRPPARAVPPTRPGRRRARLALVALFVSGAVACSADGGSGAEGTTTTGATGTEPSSVVCTDIPPAPTDDDELSVQEPFEAERYAVGSLELRLEGADGEETCLTLELDPDRSDGWDFDANLIDLTYAAAEGPSVHLRTSGEPMAGFVDATLEVSDGPAITLADPPACAFVLADMAEGRVEAWIDCPTAPSGTGDVVAVSGHLTATT